ncbi:putative nuclease HARBI1 [Pecten maximus]|uniref:putative nuclease HARBI1 n=1 Tax=Pecten maximus TaxID=6579 RepID=UPI001458E750|nr:putative nuclease HARBI1 [Pecten maximus]
MGGLEPIIIEEQLYITLWYLGENDTIQKIADRFGVGEATVTQCRNKILKIVLKNLKKKFVVWPTHEEMLEEENLFAARNGFPDIVGALDGTRIPISKPRDHPQTYVNRKGFHSIQLQAICRHDMRFSHLYVGYPGSVHDARVLRNLYLWDVGLQRCNMQHHVLADGAYPLRRWLLTPFRNNGHLTLREKKYNKYHSSIRVAIERAFGNLKGRFRRLLNLQTHSVKTACKVIMACCVLHNIYIIQGDVDLADFLDDYEEPDEILHNHLIQERVYLKEIELQMLSCEITKVLV